MDTLSSPASTDQTPDGAADTSDTKPASSEYGYVVMSVTKPCKREELVACCIAGVPDRVWTPEADGLVAPYDVPWIFEAVMAPGRKEARERFQAMSFLLGMWVLLALGLIVGGGMNALFSVFSVQMLVLVYFAASFTRSLAEWRRVRDMTPAALTARVAEMHALPLARTVRPLFTWGLAAAVAAVAIAQVAGPGSSTAAAGLVKGAVRQGEWWRLLTGPLLHGGIFHLLMNGAALLAVGETIERLAHRAYLPLVFLAAALAGSAASMLLYPHATSVGASGGLLGLIGFLGVLAFRRRELLLRDLWKEFLKDVAWTVVLGIVGYAFIDNGAHAGGLLCGIVLGLLLVPRGGGTPHWEPSAAVRTAGWASLAVIAAATATAIVAMFANLPV
jgi:membrane associated rhomboid family serine protease